jgi:DNA-binding beta-propeller fold protein YncE
VIAGQKAKLARASHGVTYDPAHDEIFASQIETGAVVVFRGDVDGEQAPIRIIQGGRTRLHHPWQMGLDLKHEELYVDDFVINDSGGILVFKRDANGDEPPLRMIAGSKSQMSRPAGVAVDPETNLVVAATMTRLSQKRDDLGGVFIFNRTDDGNVAPLRVIAGPHTGIYSAWHVATYEKHIYATISNIIWKPTFDMGGFACRPGVTKPSPWVWNHPPGFVGVWRESDDGDQPPRAIIGGGDSGVYGPVGLVLDPRDGEVMVTDQRNQLYTFLVPQIFSPTL